VEDLALFVATGLDLEGNHGLDDHLRRGPIGRVLLAASMAVLRLVLTSHMAVAFVLLAGRVQRWEVSPARLHASAVL